MTSGQINYGLENVLSLNTTKRGQSNNSEYFDVSKFVPKGMHPKFTEKGGSLYIAHSVNEFAIKVLKRKVDLVIFQCFLRYTLGFRRPICKMSYSFIANWTGLQPPNVRKGINNLIEMKLVEVAIPHSSKDLKATIYEVPIVREYLLWLNTKEKAPNLYTDQPEGYIQSENSPIIKPNTKKEKFKENYKSLSPSLAIISNYIQSLKPHQKRVDEEHYLNQILVDYNEADILKAFNHVIQNGTIDSAQPVHSPLKYLSYTIQMVLDTINKSEEKQNRINQLRREIEERESKEKLQRDQEAELYRRALRKFETQLSQEEQEIVLNDYYIEHYAGSMGFIPKNLVRQFAITDWYQSSGV